MQVVIDIPKEIYELCVKDDYFVYKETDIIRQAIKNGTPLDKIRAEIMELDYDIETIGFDLNDMPQTEMIHTVCREEVLRIIDKHKKESEDK